MAIDTFGKRASATHFLINIYTQPVIPDGAIAQGDRQAATLVYSGILAAGAPVAAPTTQYPGKIVNVARLMGR